MFTIPIWTLWKKEQNRAAFSGQFSEGGEYREFCPQKKDPRRFLDNIAKSQMVTPSLSLLFHLRW
jgi:hypothetical protein